VLASESGLNVADDIAAFVLSGVSLTFVACAFLPKPIVIARPIMVAIAIFESLVILPTKPIATKTPRMLRIVILECIVMVNLLNKCSLLWR